MLDLRLATVPRPARAAIRNGRLAGTGPAMAAANRRVLIDVILLRNEVFD